MPVAVRNNERTLVVLSHLDKNKGSIEWKPAGDPDGDDIQQVPDDFAQTTPFFKAVGIGILTVVEDSSEITAAIARQADRYRGTKKAEVDATEALVDRASQNGVIRLTEADLDTHIQRLEKSQPSELSTLGEDNTR